jgi:hypothetical protein
MWKTHQETTATARSKIDRYKYKLLQIQNKYRAYAFISHEFCKIETQHVQKAKK